MRSSSSILALWALLTVTATEAAFVPQQRSSSSTAGWTTTAKPTVTARNLVPLDGGMMDVSSSMMDSSSLWNSGLVLATVDQDIAKMSDNEFLPVFMGGMAVMFGGLLSAVFVGVIVDKKDLSASIVATSYAQGGDDEEFWKGLSEEEKKKAQALLQRVKETGGEKIAPSATAATAMEGKTSTPVEAAAPVKQVVVETKELKSAAAVSLSSPASTPPVVSKQPATSGADMFDDY
jgi:hypothetical protein